MIYQDKTIYDSKFLAFSNISASEMFISDKEEALFRRYNRKRQPDLVFEFTRDPGLLHQYYLIREREFNLVQGVNSYSGAESDHDRNGHIMIVRSGNFCVGGLRINVRTPRKPTPLPLEIKDFRIEDHFSELKNKELKYGQVGGLTLLPEFRGGDVTLSMFKRLRGKASALGLDVLFCVSPLINIRLYKLICISIGLKDTAIHYDVELPAYPDIEEIKHYLLSSYIPKDAALGPDDYEAQADGWAEHASLEHSM